MSNNNFFRKDLNLKSRWWHRFLSVIFIVAFIAVVGFSISSMFGDYQLPKYTKVGMLSDRMNSEIRLIGSLVTPEEKIAMYEHNLYESNNGSSLYDKNGGWLLKQEYYCSKNVSTHIEEISAKTGVNYYKGNTGLVSLDDFKKYLIQNNAGCVEVLDLDSVVHFGNVKKALSWGLEADDMAVWQESMAKSIFAVLQTVFFEALGFLIILVLYYKVFLYIAFGSRKSS
ncbi:MAG TPA: hypothetical protein VGO63_02535 [Candidatus Paceibacterota bacterium]|jgi:hypothetical protein|nr:hypothetical protein [Candidatus Paceibacterota bacterium]